MATARASARAAAKPSSAKASPRRKAAPPATVLPARGSGSRAKLKVVDSPPPLFDLESVLKDMPENYVQCRDFMHAWKPYSASYDPATRTYKSTLRCNRCTTLKVRVINRFGSVESSHYDYPDGYTIEGSGRLDGDARDKIRLRSIMHLISTDTAEDAHA